MHRGILAAPRRRVKERRGWNHLRCRQFQATLTRRKPKRRQAAALGPHGQSAARLIGTLKQKYELDATFRTRQDGVKSFYQAVEVYNHLRPHLSLNYEVPARVHARGD